MNEVHHIAKKGATVHVATPHFPFIDSYSVPTHRWHLSSEWHVIMTDSYLEGQVSYSPHLKTKISFGKNVFSFIPRIIIKLKGINWWEKTDFCLKSVKYR